MERNPAEIQRRIRRLRWTGALLWIGWLLLAIPLYYAFRFMPQLVATPAILAASTSVLGLGAVWFIYVVYRLGELAGEADAGSASSTDAAGEPSASP